MGSVRVFLADLDPELTLATLRCHLPTLVVRAWDLAQQIAEDHRKSRRGRGAAHLRR
jgi:hypothetical protein